MPAAPKNLEITQILLPPAVVAVFQGIALYRRRDCFLAAPMPIVVQSAIVLTAMHDVYTTPSTPARLAALEDRTIDYQMHSGVHDEDAILGQAYRGVDLVVRHWRKHPTMPDDRIWRAELLDPERAWTWKDYSEAIANGLKYHQSPMPTTNKEYPTMTTKDDPHTGRPRILRPASGLLGAYVTATLRGKEDTRQGVFIGHDDDGAALVLGEVQDHDTPYICEPDVAVVPDENIFVPSTIEHINRIRAEWAPPARERRQDAGASVAGVNQGMLSARRAVLACPERARQGDGACGVQFSRDLPQSVYDAVLAAVAKAEA